MSLLTFSWKNLFFFYLIFWKTKNLLSNNQAPRTVKNEIWLNCLSGKLHSHIYIKKLGKFKKMKITSICCYAVFDNNKCQPKNEKQGWKSAKNKLKSDGCKYFPKGWPFFKGPSCVLDSTDCQYLILQTKAVFEFNLLLLLLFFRLNVATLTKI